MFELDPDNPESRELITITGELLAAGETVYYTGHCTGDYAYERLQAMLGSRLRPMTGGSDVWV